MEHKSPVALAIEHAGGLSRLAALVGVKPPTVHEWKTGERQVPAERCMEIEAATRGRVTCEQLRPDLKWHVVRHGPAPDRPHDQANRDKPLELVDRRERDLPIDFEDRRAAPGAA